MRPFAVVLITVLSSQAVQLHAEVTLDKVTTTGEEVESPRPTTI